MADILFSSWWYWLIGAAVLLILEIIVPGIFLIWLGLGAALTGLFLLVFPDAAPAWQLLALAASICLSVVAGLKWQRKLIRHQPTTLNQGLDGYIGQLGQVNQPFIQGQGRISLDDSSWPALCDAPLSGGQRVRITAVENGYFRVTPL